MTVTKQQLDIFWYTAMAVGFMLGVSATCIFVLIVHSRGRPETDNPPAPLP
jgi:hypothetical protein